MKTAKATITPPKKELIIKPQSGLLVRHPDGKPLAKDGEKVKRSAYWIRRVNDKSVIELKTLPEKKAAPAQTSTEEPKA